MSTSISSPLGLRPEAVGRPQRSEERVVGMPGVRVCADREVGDVGAVLVRAPVEFAVRHEIRPALQEALIEQRLPFRELADVAEQSLARLVAPVHRGDDEVVPLAAVEVDHDRAEGQRVGGGPRDRQEQLRQLLARPHEPRDLEEAAEPREDR
jgi:hypothetical protein